MIVNVVGAVAGSLLLSLSSTLHLVGAGRLTGLSGIFEGLLKPSTMAFRWKSVYTSGMILSFIATSALAPATALPRAFHGTVLSWTGAAVGGALVGLGTRLGSGCTSGHGLCGLSRFSARSFAAVATFLTTGVITACICDTFNLFRVVPGDFDVPLPVLKWLCIPLAILPLITAFRERRGRDTTHDLLTFVSGVLFAAGLVVSTMIRPDVLLGFLTMTSPETFDLTLGIVFGTGVLLNTISFQNVFRRVKEPLKSPSGMPSGARSFEIPSMKEITPRLVFGAALFGTGWGIAGACPGPALGLFSIGMPKFWLAVPCMLLGMQVSHMITEK